MVLLIIQSRACSVRSLINLKDTIMAFDSFKVRKKDVWKYLHFDLQSDYRPSMIFSDDVSFRKLAKRFTQGSPPFYILLRMFHRFCERYLPHRQLSIKRSTFVRKTAFLKLSKVQVSIRDFQQYRSFSYSQVQAGPTRIHSPLGPSIAMTPCYKTSLNFVFQFLIVCRHVVGFIHFPRCRGVPSHV